jgi:uncharacterized protein
VVADLVGLPSGYLFAALLVGLGYALVLPGRLALPGAGFRVGQAVTGVALGTFLRPSTLTDLGSHWLPVTLVSLATLVVTIGAGTALARFTRLDRPTASLGMVAGGASGIVAMADELGGDDRLVAFMQYLRVLVVTLLTPIIVPIAFGVHGAGGPGEGPLLGTAAGWALTVGASVAGVLIGPRLRLPAPALLGPLILTAGLSVSGAIGDTQVPALAREVAFSLIGLQIGLGFERRTLTEIAGLAGPVALSIVALLASCFGRLPGHHPGRPVRGAADRLRQRRRCRVRARRPGDPAVCHGARGARSGALAGAEGWREADRPELQRSRPSGSGASQRALTPGALSLAVGAAGRSPA